MSEVRYEAHPRIFRMRPLATLAVALVALAGFVLVGFGERLAPGVLVPLGIPLSGQTAQYLGVGLFALGCLQIYIWYAPTRFQRFTVTDDTVRLADGFLTKQYTEVSIDSVRTLHVTQGVLQRLMGVGDVTVFTTGDRPEIQVRGLPDPDRIRGLMTERMAAPA